MSYGVSGLSVNGEEFHLPVYTLEYVTTLNIIILSVLLSLLLSLSLSLSLSLLLSLLL